MKVKLRQQSITVRAPRSVVFALISAFGDNGGNNRSPSNDGEGQRLVEREGNRLVMEFHSRDGRKMYRTLEEVVLYPDEKITFKHLEGPLYHSEEEFVFTELGSATMMTHNAEIECRMSWLPGAGWVVARFYVKGHYERLVLRHMTDLKERAEAGISA